MALLIGTDKGLYRVRKLPFDLASVEPVLESGSVTSVRRFDQWSEVFASTSEGVYRSPDGGRTWENLNVPAGDGMFWDVLATAEGTLYAGTDEPCLYRSGDRGVSWELLANFTGLPSRSKWMSPVDPDGARIRALESVPGRSAGLIVGIESGGIHVSDDGGETWNDRRSRSPDDIHQILPLGPTEFLVATGFFDLDRETAEGHALGDGGVYRTTDTARTWTRLDTGNEHSYVRQVFLSDGVLHFCGARTPPPEWRDQGADAALFESTTTGNRIERVSYPGEPDELIEAWTLFDGQIVCGTSSFGLATRGSSQGRIIQKDGHRNYRTVGKVPANVSALENVKPVS